MHREARRKRAPQGTAKQFALGAKLTVDEIDDYIGCVRQTCLGQGLLRRAEADLHN